jgi:hypothetical protein
MTDFKKIVKIIENNSPELAAEEILRLFSVSNRRELLIAFLDDIHSRSYEHIKSDTTPYNRSCV